jgi:outer membrane usher protein
VKNLRYSVTAGRYRSYDNDVEKTPLPRAAQSTAYLTDSPPTAACSRAAIISLRRWASVKTWAIWRVLIDVTRAKALLKNSRPAKGSPGACATAKISRVHQLLLAGYRYNSKGFYTLEDTMESYTRADDWSAPQQRRA